MSPTTGRREYQSDNGVDLARFVPWSLLTFAAALVLAGGLAALFQAGFYFILIMPMLAAMLLMPFILGAVHFGHCRNRLLGVMLGVTAGALMYLGSFQFHLAIVTHRPDALLRVDKLAAYIQLRMETDVYNTSPGGTHTPRPNSPGDVVFHWITFSGECLFVILTVGGAGWARPARAYCTQCRKWKKQVKVVLAPGGAAAVADLVVCGKFDDVTRLPRSAPQINAARTLVALEFCPPAVGSGVSIPMGTPGSFAAPQPCPVYLAAREMGNGMVAAGLRDFDSGMSAHALPRVEVAHGELSSLLPLFPEAAPLLSPSNPAAATVVAAPVTGATVVAPPDPTRRVVFAEVTTIDSDERVLSMKHIIIGNLLILSMLIGIFVALALAGAGVKLLTGTTSAYASLGVALVAGGAILFGLITYCTITDTGLLGNIYLRRLARHIYGRRPDAIVSPDDPEAVFVEVIPRSNWGKAMLQTAVDVGFLLPDVKSRMLAFEGDKERWIVPLESVDSCVVDGYESQENLGSSRTNLVVLTIHTPRGKLEYPMIPCGRGRNSLRSRRKDIRALELFNLINKAIGPA